ncbi:carboxypeptidase-like regulatory domain-containing protein [Saccharicrinis sp. FJH62]|uniref:carboxypeptidase-like regulatory domain-containing protein n=1 Tax=Saccharicrinis sp. FJH62 TaxID=3344657 RepID=UPI0035D3F7AF
MKSTLVLIFFFALFTKSYSVEITGNIKDTDTGKPVEYAAVYINGTTIGTISNTEGYFSLNYEFDNCQLVVNHLSYNLVVVNIAPGHSSNLIINLEPKNIEISQINVQSENLRSKNLTYFKKVFLGNNFWGENAEILNDSVLVFRSEYFGDDAPRKELINKIKYFEVKAMAPLQIDLPRLGYLLQYDMVRFVEAYDPQYGMTIINNLGYIYFKSYDHVSRLKEMRFRRNRYKVYYHSIMHFVRSLYDNKLAENGYDVFTYSKNDSVETITQFSLDTCDCISYKNDEASITGMKGRKILIHYYTNNFKPTNLSKYNDDASWRILTGLKPASYSLLYVGKDTCVIRKDGTLPGGGELIFNGDIAKKRYGAILPSDFEP